MKNALLLAALLMASSMLFAQKELLYETKSFSSNVKRVDARSVGGSISVVAAPTQNYKVEVVLTPNYSKDEITDDELRERVKQFDIVVKEEGGLLQLEGKSKTKDLDWKKSVNISFRVYGPKQLQTDFYTSGGSISYKGVGGLHKFKTSGGSLLLNNVNGTVDGNTSGGSINVTSSDLQGSLKSSGGSVNADGVKGKLTLHTSGGSLNFKDLDGDFDASTSGGSLSGASVKGTLKASTSGGSLRLDDMQCSLRADNAGGNMQVRITKLGSYVELHNSSGNISVMLPANAGMNLSVSGADLRFSNVPGLDTEIQRRSFKGDISGGGVPVTIRASNGLVNLALGSKTPV